MCQPLMQTHVGIWNKTKEMVTFVSSNGLVTGYLRSSLRQVNKKWSSGPLKTEMLPLMGRYLSPIIVLMAKGQCDVN